MAIQHTYVQESDGRRSLAVFHDGELLVATSANPGFDTILSGVLAGDLSVIDLFNPARAVERKFQRLSNRVTVDAEGVKWDGDVIHNSLTSLIVRHMDEGVQDWEGLVAFFENVQENPSENSRNELFDWIGNDESVTITDDGYLVAYKGCYVDANGVPVSTVAAPAEDGVRVDDVLVTGPVPNVDGTIVSMPRGVVDDNLNIHCSKGLHVGTYAYASMYVNAENPNSSGVVVEVQVHPRNVVSVTSDSARQKIRVCEYEALGVVTEQYQQAVIAAPVNGRRDTRDNHKQQDRYPAGTYIDGKPMGGRFIPAGV